MINISWLMQFLEVTDRKSINKAAEELYISQSVLSRNIKKLEEYMGYPLLVRSNQGIRLTKEGRLLYQCSMPLKEEIKTIELLRKKKEVMGCSELHIYLFSLLLKSELLLDYVSGDNGDSIILKIYETKLMDLLQGVQDDEFGVGIAVLSDPEVAALENKVSQSSLTMEVLDQGGLYLQVRESCTDFDRQERLPEDRLKDMRYIHLDLDIYSILRLGIKINGVPLTSLKQVIQVNSYSAMMGLLAETNSFSFGSKWQADEMKRHGIKCIEIPDAETKMNLVLILNRQAVSLEARAFVNILKRAYHLLP